ncbi:hypothetical protein [Pseudomonas frederiksbergensis]|uniref:hypothetical protein n=1 Tax=Pseudomonas frederiksbergensis TaxID=104087 RepID=UPI001F490753|nr:hypothetical protein [Pseudomonas frederiksbergensis]
MDDPNYQAIKALETDGKGFKDAQSAFFATGAFDEYSKWDQVNDDLLLNDKDLKQSARASRAVLGAIGAAAGFGGAILTTPACVTGVGCAIPAFSGLGGAASFVDGWQATGQLFAPYDYTQGSKVLASFDSATYPGDVNPLRDYGTEAAKAALEIALLKGAGKYLEGTGASVLVSGVKKDGAVVGDGAKATASTAGSAAQNGESATGLLSTQLAKDAKSYLTDIQSLTGRQFTPQQLELLKADLQENSYSRLSKEEVKLNRAEFDSKLPSLRREWEKNTGESWPKETYVDKYGKEATRNYDAHHVIENKFGGKAEWWNITHAVRGVEHQGGIHRAQGPAEKIFGK